MSIKWNWEKKLTTKKVCFVQKRDDKMQFSYFVLQQMEVRIKIESICMAAIGYIKMHGHAHGGPHLSDEEK